jgi:cytochrome c oxidase assembly protein subunit 15
VAAFFYAVTVMARPVQPWLTRYAALTAFLTLALIGLGGLVTSHGAGLAVPDWPTSYGYNMFFFPISQWVGGIFYEHTHRLLASLVGLMTVFLAAWLWRTDERRWMRWLGVLAVLAVSLQGVLGGLRVTALKDELGIFHATLAQLFLVLLSALTLWSTAWWRDRARAGRPICVTRRTTYLFVAATALILLQLVLGATMRHQHAGLAVPDFPTAYGQLWPPMDADSVARYNQLRTEVAHVHPITPFGLALHMAHRSTALLVLAAVALAAWQARRQWGWTEPLTKLACGWLGLICVQVVLGAATVWTNKSADITTLHVVVGSISLVAGALLLLAMYRRASWPAALEPAAVAMEPRVSVEDRSTLA